MVKPILVSNIPKINKTDISSNEIAMMCQLIKDSQLTVNNLQMNPSISIDAIKHFKFKNQAIISNYNKDQISLNPVMFSPMSINKSYIVALAEKDKVLLCNIQQCIMT